MTIRDLLALLFVALTAPALAADVVYPPGSRLGLVPPPGLTVSANFPGYEDPANKVGIVFAAAPLQAYDEIEKSATAETLKKQGITLESREPFPLAAGKAFLVIGQQEIDNAPVRKWLLVVSAPELAALVNVIVPDAAKAAYPDSVIRAALATLSIRPGVPAEEQLSLLPFKMSELAGFGISGVVPGRAIMLADDPSPAGGSGFKPHLLISVSPGAPAQASERDVFAREVFAGIPNLKDVQITTSETLRIAGQQGHQILATAKDGATGADVTVVQWLRFGGTGFLQFIGVAASKDWVPAYTRFRSVRDGIDPR